MNNQLVLRASICLSTLHLSHTPTVYRILCVCLSGIMSRYNKTVLKPCSILAFHSAHLTRCQPHGTARWTGFDFNLDVWVAIKVMIIKMSVLLNEHPLKLIVLMTKGQTQHAPQPRHHRQWVYFLMRLSQLNYPQGNKDRRQCFLHPDDIYRFVGSV